MKSPNWGIVMNLPQGKIILFEIYEIASQRLKIS